jgi:hypothetical protein
MVMLLEDQLGRWEQKESGSSEIAFPSLEKPFNPSSLSQILAAGAEAKPPLPNLIGQATK